MDARLASIGRMIEAFALWAQVLDAHRASPFGDLRLTRSQVEALFLIAHAGVPMTPGRLAEALNVTPGAVTQLVAGLTAEGLVEQAREQRRAQRGDSLPRSVAMQGQRQREFELAESPGSIDR